MTTLIATKDLSFSAYTDRQYREVEPGKLLERAMMVEPSGNYRWDGAGWLPQAYPGFAVLSMADEHPGNARLPLALAGVQRELMERCPWEESLYLLPPDSFHQTVANTLSAERYVRHILEPGLVDAYPGIVAGAFAKIASQAGGGRRGPLAMKLIGIGIFGTALGVLGVFESEEDYREILRFRAGFYSDPQLAALDVRMTRPFIGHITLAYIENDLSGEQRRQLAEAVVALNDRIREIAPVFLLAGAGLRRYDHLSAFARADAYPRYDF